MKTCVIYCRVSSERQVREGNGLSSQEQRCRSFAAAQGYHVLHVFRDEGVSGAVLDRPGIRDLLKFLKTHRSSQPIMVVVDDISRIARSVQTHILLRTKLDASGGALVSPSFNFDRSAMGEFMEVIFAGVAQYGRTGNREQVLNRMRARLEAGFWTFPPPPGYVFGKSKVHKKIAQPNSDRAGLVKEALEGFATNRFVTQRHIVEFLMQQGYFADLGEAHSSKYEMAVHRILTNTAFYAGYIEYAPWNIERRAGQHEAIIDRPTMLAIQMKLSGNMPTPPRKDYEEEFVLRNFVRCSACGRPLTASRTKGGRFPRYHCYNQKNCLLYGHTIRPEKLHADFETLLGDLEASDPIMGLVRNTYEETWHWRLQGAVTERRQRQRAVQEAAEHISAVVRLMSREDEAEVVEEYKTELKRLQGVRQQAENALAVLDAGAPNYKEAFEKVGTMLQHPLQTWQKGSRHTKKTVCQVVFTVPPMYHRERGFGTIDLSLPYQVTKYYSTPKSRMVDLPRNTWYQFMDFIVEWAEGIED